MQPLFIGDEVTAAAYRLAGADVVVVSPEDEAAVATLRAAMREERPLVLVTMELAARLPRDELLALLAALAPPLLPVADAAGRGPEPDLAAWIRSGIIG